MSAAPGPDRRLHWAALAIGFLRKAPETVLAIPAILGFLSRSGLSAFLLFAAVGALIAFGMALLRWLRFTYRVSSDHLVIESGVFGRHKRSIPFDHVQDTTIERPLLARIFGTAVLKLETASGGKNEAVLDSISLSEAERIRDLVRRTPFSNRQVEPAEKAEARPLFRMEMPRLLLAGLFSFSFLFLALVGALLEVAGPFIGFDHHRWMLAVRAAADRLGPGSVAGALGLFLVLGLLSGVAQTLAHDYRFRLDRTATGLRRNRGLFTVSEVVLSSGRVQLAVIKTGPLRRLLRWFRLELQTLGSEAGSASHQVVAPLARVSEIRPILGELGLHLVPPSVNHVRVSRSFVIQRSTALLAILAVASAGLGLLWPPAFLLVVLFPLCVIIPELEWRTQSYYVSASALHVRKGIFRQRLWLIPLSKVQAVTLSRSLSERAWKLRTLHIDTAGASRFGSPRIAGLDKLTAEFLASRLIHSSALAAAR